MNLYKIKMIVCNNCGTENPDYALFCEECGTELDLIYCPRCGHGNSSDAKFCQECGKSLTEEKDPDCPACNTGFLTESFHEGTLGIGNKVIYTCSHCGAVFEEKGDKYKLTHIHELNNPVWQKYRNKPLTFEEWTRIANGGVSDEEQEKIDRERKEREIREAKALEERKKREAEEQKNKDINIFMDKLAKGNINLTSSTPSLIIPKKNEETSLVMLNVSFLEARSVRQTIGGYGGPTFRVAKGVSFRLGGVSARSVSHDEIKKIDQGTLVLTNKRLVFLGDKKTVNIDLRKIIAIEPFKDGIGSQRENKQKTEYFTGTQNTSLNFTGESGRISLPLNGVVLRAAILGNITKFG